MALCSPDCHNMDAESNGQLQCRGSNPHQGQHDVCSNLRVLMGTFRVLLS